MFRSSSPLVWDFWWDLGWRMWFFLRVAVLTLFSLTLFCIYGWESKCRCQGAVAQLQRGWRLHGRIWQLGPIPPAQTGNKAASLGMGMAKAGGPVGVSGVAGWAEQSCGSRRQHPMATMIPSYGGPRLGWRGARGEDTKAHGRPQGADCMWDCLLQKIKGFKIINVLSVFFRSNNSRWSIS